MSKTNQAESVARERWTQAGLYFEYSKAANPVGHQISKVPYADFPSRGTRRARRESPRST